MKRVSVRDLHATIPVDVYDEFREVMLDKHRDSPAGAISEELTAAMKAHIVRVRTHTQSAKMEDEEKKRLAHSTFAMRMNQFAGWRKINRKYDELVNYLENESKHKIKLRPDDAGLPHTIVIPESIWLEAIRRVGGRDKRTIESWTRIFINDHYVAFCPSKGLGLPNKYMISASQYQLTEADIEEHKSHGKWLTEIH